MIIGFDFDKVFIDYPPFIPYNVVDFIYKGKLFRKGKKNNLSYRFPGPLERKIRLFSHHPYLRKPINDNINALKEIAKKKNVSTYLVSSRYSFLKKITEEILRINKLKQYFKGIYFNYENQQPHLFKEETIRQLKIEKYVDDDLDLALYLSKKLPKLKIYWIKNTHSKKISMPKNIFPINDVQEFLDKHL